MEREKDYLDEGRERASSVIEVANLQRDIAELSAFYFAAKEKETRARNALDCAECELRGFEAKKQLELRMNPPSNIKITEESVKALIDADLGVKEKRIDVLRLKDEYRKASDVVTSLEMRQSALKDLVKLATWNSFAGSTWNGFDTMNAFQDAIKDDAIGMGYVKGGGNG